MYPQNSTNVRPEDLLPHLPEPQAATLEAELFLTPPPRRPSHPQELALFSRADSFELEFDGERLPVHVFPNAGPAVLLLHGWGGSSHQLHGFVEPLLARGATVAAFDAPGHGSASGTWLAIPRYAQAIARVAERVGPLAGLIGHSMGAAAGAFALGAGSSAERVVLIGPPASELEFFHTWLRALHASDALLDSAARAVERRVGVSFEALGPQPIAAGVSVPMLVIHDRDDREVPWADGAAIAQAARDARLITTSGLGHRRILRDPAVIDASAEFAAGALRTGRADSNASFVAVM